MGDAEDKKTSLMELEDHEIDWLHPEQYLEGYESSDHAPAELSPNSERFQQLCSRIEVPVFFRRRGDEGHELVHIDRYAIDEVVGRGGMGMVVAGWDPKLGRRVAIKLCLDVSEAGQEVLRREAMILARLRHPNIIAVHDFGTFEGDFYMVMDYVDGMNGRRWLEQWVTVGEVCRVFSAAIRGLDGAHRAGVLHGDFKPSNVLVAKTGEVFVADFGVAELLSVEDSADGDEEPRRPRGGTLVYMAPERLRGRRGDERSDQYSACVSMWAGLQGSWPFAGKTAEEMLKAIERGEARVGSQPALGEISDALEQVLLRGLRPDPRDRHESMAALLEAIEETQSTGGAEPLRDRRWLHAPLMFGVMVVAFALSLGAMWWGTRQTPASELLAEVAEVSMPAQSAVDVAVVLIRDGKRQEGLLVWEADLERRKTRKEPFGQEGLRVGAALLARGEKIVEDDPEEAKKLAEEALTLASVLGDELGDSADSLTKLTTDAQALHHRAIQ
ncbi:serine/threonine kinase PKN8 [Plesiocystis pacifica SIR-1]|uniref:Serine/threonine kinase PKN8 n=2 Tax=Plesiocystis pacifica TaxID=191768 RepID=A6G6Q5_9BACT|nr:serine/threonine kinase PKN8 [Plesiocystis pacifica SIR-1]